MGDIVANAREIRMRIKSISETKKITKAMKLISAAKLKKARQQLEKTLPYFEKVQSTIADILLHSKTIESIYFDNRDKKQHKTKAYIVMAGDKGLTGGYNHNILKLGENTITDKENSVVFPIGNVTRSYYVKKGYKENTEIYFQTQNPDMHNVREIAKYIVTKFKNKEIDEIYLVYTRMESSIKLVPEVMKLLPLDVNNMKGVDLTKTPPDENLTFEPSVKTVFEVLISKYIKGIIYGALVEAFTSEQSARMNAMDSATDNAEEMIRHLTLNYNRARQAAITQEITEIVSGASAAI